MEAAVFALMLAWPAEAMGSRKRNTANVRDIEKVVRANFPSTKICSAFTADDDEVVAETYKEFLEDLLFTTPRINKGQLLPALKVALSEEDSRISMFADRILGILHTVRAKTATMSTGRKLTPAIRALAMVMKKSSDPKFAEKLLQGKKQVELPDRVVSGSNSSQCKEVPMPVPLMDLTPPAQRPRRRILKKTPSDGATGHVVATTLSAQSTATSSAKSVAEMTAKELRVYYGLVEDAGSISSQSSSSSETSSSSSPPADTQEDSVVALSPRASLADAASAVSCITPVAVANESAFASSDSKDYKQYWDSCRHSTVRSFADGTLLCATMREGPAGFQEALWPDGTVEQSEAPNVLLMAKEAAMKRPAGCIKRPATKKKTTKTQKTRKLADESEDPDEDEDQNPTEREDEAGDESEEEEAQQGESEQAEAPIKSAATSSSKLSAYDQARLDFTGAADEWQESKQRHEAIQAMGFGEVRRRRFERLRPDMFEYNPATKKYDRSTDCSKKR